MKKQPSRWLMLCWLGAAALIGAGTLGGALWLGPLGAGMGLLALIVLFFGASVSLAVVDSDNSRPYVSARLQQVPAITLPSSSPSSPPLPDSEKAASPSRFLAAVHPSPSAPSSTDRQEIPEEVQRANEAKNLFLATISHEIRTPLAGLIGLAEALSRTPLDEVQSKQVATLTRTAEEMLRLINDLLDLSKAESGTIELEELPFSLPQLAEETLAVVTPLAERKGLPVRLELGPGLLPVVRGDAGRLRQVLLNLLSNAVRFTERGEVVLSIQADPAGVRFSVNDSGIGIAPEALQRIFEPFSQAHRSTARTHGGTGLGLAICSRLVEYMGGQLLVESTLGQGSTFSFVLPLPATALAPTAPSYHGEETVQQQLGRSLHVLVVEDNPVSQQVLTMMLERLGCSWEVAENGEQGVLCVSQKRYDVVLMDLQMPGVDGLRATRLIRAAEREGPRVPIVACTANAMEGERDRCLSAGMDDYLTKPVRSRQLLECFARLFGATGRAHTPKPLVRTNNWRTRLQSMGFDREAIQRLAQSFCDSVPSRLYLLRAAYDAKEYAQVRLMAHTLKSSLTIFAADQAAQAAAHLEQRAAANDLSDTAEALLRLESDTRALLEDVCQSIEPLA